MKLNKFCPMCMKQTEVEVDISQEDYYAYLVGDKNIQEVFPKVNPLVRDFIRVGICLDCGERLYNVPAPGHEAKFGKRLGECSCCGKAVWEKDLVKGNFTCKDCGSDSYE